MSRLSVFVTALLVLAGVLLSCKKESENLQVQIEAVVTTDINPIKKQIEEINSSIADLEQTDKALKGYIETLEGTARQLQADIAANDTKIDQTATALRNELTTAQTELNGNIAIAKTEVLGQLTSLRSELQGKQDAVNTTISELKSKDTALEAQIANLQTYVDTQLALQTANTKEWASSTFLTLAQYQSTTDELAAIKSSITTLNASLADLETRLNTKIAADIASAVSTLEGELATKVTEITTSYTSAVSTAKTEVTTAYTSAIATAISNSETSMKNWVNAQLTGYCTIAKAEIKLDSLHTVLNGQLTSQQEYLTAMIGSLEEQLVARVGDEKTLDTLKTAKAQLESALATTNEAVAANTKSIDSLSVNLAKAKIELTEAYTTAINTAISTLDGKLTGDIATAVTTINTRIDQEVAALDAKITTLTSRVSACETAIAAIQVSLQTMQTDIATLGQQITAINGSISELQATDAQLDGYIKTLQTTAANLQTALNATEEALAQAKSELKTDITNEKAAVLAELTSARTAIEGQIEQINTAIETLQSKDVALEHRIDTLSTYVNTLNQGTKDWASATFSTLEQYNKTAGDVATIKTTITSLNTELTELVTRLNAKIGTDIATAVSTLEGELATKVSELTTAYTGAINTAKTELTAAYTTAIANAISASETSLKGWVNEQLTGYYTIAQTEAQLNALNTTLTSQLNAQKTYFDELIAARESDLNGKITASAAVIDSLNTVSAQSTQAIAENKVAIATLIQSLNEAKTELTDSYTSAIATAISSSEGKLEDEIATQIAAVNASVDTKIAAVNTEISGLKTRVSTLETAVSTINARLTDIESRLAELEKLLGQIQSVVVIPEYADGSVGCTSGNTTFYFKVLPTGTAAQLAEAPLSAFKMEAVYTKTKALPTFVDMPISQVEAEGDILIVTASGENIGTDFFKGLTAASVSLKVSIGISNCQTDFFPLYFKAIESITLNKSETTLPVGECETLIATVNPESASDKSIHWESSNESVAEVTENGLVTAIASGTATISVTAKDGSGKSASCSVTVIKLVDSIGFDKTSLVLYNDETATITATVLSETANNRNLMWSSSNTSVATVSSSGVVTGVSRGTAIITATAQDGSGISQTCEVEVKQYVTGITLDKTSLTLTKGKTVTLTPTISPSNANDKSVTWSSSNTAVATVDQSGKVTAVSGGGATINVTAKDGSGRMASCSVAVGQNLSANASANCYVVSSAGDYLFRTTKGNSSTSVGSVSSVTVLWESYGTSTAPSVGSIVNNVSYSNNAIFFSTPSTLKNGNAVIAAKNASGTILWSWHIWVCSGYNPASSAQIYNYGAGTMMDRNLGATSATPGNVGALGLMYQWGRKDPFLGSSSISSNTKASSTLSWPSAVSSTSSSGTVAYAVKNPTTFIKGVEETSYDWVYSSRDNTLWKSDKTIYDPCPPGWRVPDGGSTGVWATANNSLNPSWDNTKKGMNFSGKFGPSSYSTIWYPAVGCLFDDTYKLGNVGRYSYWWSCTPSDSKAYNLYYYQSGNVLTSDDDSRANGFSVRCLKE